MALLLYRWRRRLHSKILPNELSRRRYHFAVPTASSSNLFYGLPYSLHCHIPGLVASGTPLSRKFSTIFMLRCDRIPVMLNLFSAVQ
jgi:hypothetical protein